MPEMKVGLTADRQVFRTCAVLQTTLSHQTLQSCIAASCINIEYSFMCTLHHKALRLISSDNRREEISASVAKPEEAGGVSLSPPGLISAFGTTPFPHSVTAGQDISLHHATGHYTALRTDRPIRCSVMHAVCHSAHIRDAAQHCQSINGRQQHIQ